jgi:hypothetical protein
MMSMIVEAIGGETVLCSGAVAIHSIVSCWLPHSCEGALDCCVVFGGRKKEGWNRLKEFDCSREGDLTTW